MEKEASSCITRREMVRSLSWLGLSTTLAPVLSGCSGQKNAVPDTKASESPKPLETRLPVDTPKAVEVNTPAVFTLDNLKRAAIKSENGFKLDIESPLLGCKIPVEIWDEEIVEKHVRLLNAFKTVPPKDINIVKGLIYTDYWQMVSVADFGSPVENPLQIKTPEDTFKLAKILDLTLREVKSWKGDYYELFFKVPWMTERELAIVFNGDFVLDHAIYDDFYFKYEKYTTE